MQLVDLLTDELKPQGEPLLGHHVLIAWGAFSCLLVMLSVWQGVSLWMLEDELETNREAVDAVTTANRKMKDERSSDANALINDLERLREEQLERKELVAVLAGYRAQGGFSGHLKSLARSHVDGLWLNEIRLDQSANAETPTVLLKGQALHPKHVPAYLYNVADDQYFAGQRFDQFELKIDRENELVEFELVGPTRKEGSG